MAPELVAAFVDEFNAELRRLAGNVKAERDGARRVLANVERKIAGIVKAIEDGAYHPTLKDRLTTLEKEKEVASARLAAARPAPLLRLHPGLHALYKNKVENLAAALNEPGTATEAGEIVRGLIDRIVLTPADGILRVNLYGDLASLMNFADAQEPTTKSAGSPGDPALLSVVAGTSNQRYLQALRARIPILPRPLTAGKGVRFP